MEIIQDTSASDDWRTDSRRSGIIAAIGRVMLAAIFLWSGYGKITDQASALGYIQSVKLPAPEVALWAVIGVELLGGIALALGYKTRIVAAGLAVFCIVSALVFHTAFNDPNQLINFFKNIAMAGGLLQIVAFGPGSCSLDYEAGHPRPQAECAKLPG
jgi:putative oxidoreductase